MFYLGVPFFKLYPLSKLLMMRCSKRAVMLFLETATICGENLAITVLLVRNMIPNLRKSALKH